MLSTVQRQVEACADADLVILKVSRLIAERPRSAGTASPLCRSKSLSGELDKQIASNSQ